MRLSPSGKLGDPEVYSSVPPSSVRRIRLSVMWRTVQAIQLSPCTTYTDTSVLESFTRGCLAPGMLHSPSSFEVYKPLLAGINQVCTGDSSTPGGLSPHSNYLISCCLVQRTVA